MEPGTILDGKYLIIRFLGRGGMGEVYQARHGELDNEVAIKIMNPTFTESPQNVARFQREAHIILRLQHKNIVGVQSFGNWDGRMYMAMEFIGGETLREFLHKNGALKPAIAIPLLLQICDAMTYAHNMDILHRDLKPDNILLIQNADGSATVKVVDFGLATLVDGSAIQRLTKTGHVVGDPNYMSPEQCQGTALDARSDVYACGCMMYELFSGRQPFKSETPTEALYKHLRDEPKPFAAEMGLPPAVEAITFRAMEKDPDARYQSFEQLAQQLREFERDPKIVVDAPTKTAFKSYWSRTGGIRLRTAILIGVAVGIMCVCAVALRTAPREGSSSEKKCVVAQTQRRGVSEPGTGRVRAGKTRGKCQRKSRPDKSRTESRTPRN